ncbi:uncharacterized protein PSFLO_07089 [Pseudozyma flocculosa]|uniref:Uncharacterized protein n=1 Tax=Pseudozyma flocculosa TaxID=84751 RepID=A0A5C3FD96_9BASI|nr:uncharacterized protein PSFLO_07089 [Pseudozyma flocculosa]
MYYILCSLETGTASISLLLSIPDLSAQALHRPWPPAVSQDPEGVTARCVHAWQDRAWKHLHGLVQLDSPPGSVAILSSELCDVAVCPVQDDPLNDIAMHWQVDLLADGLVPNVVGHATTESLHSQNALVQGLVDIDYSSNLLRSVRLDRAAKEFRFGPWRMDS